MEDLGVKAHMSHSPSSKSRDTSRAASATRSFWLDRPVFVTGCTGFLGSWLTSALVDAGATVVGLVRDQVPYSRLRTSGYQDRITVVRGPVTDYELIERALNEYEIDTIIHLAAQTIVTIANRAPLSTFETNIKGTWTVLEAARRTPTITRVVVASSDKAYGAHERLPYTEDSPLLGHHPYDVSKACADLIAHTYAVTYDLPVAITRCANLYGAGDLNWNRIVPGTMRSVIRGKRPIIRSNGTPLRDYLYVRDAVRAYLMLTERLHQPGVKGEAFNFGMNDPKSVLEIVNAIIALSNHPELKPMILNDAPNEIQAQYFDSSKAKRTIDWTPIYSLEEGLQETLAWCQEFLSQ
jgi:CDP-glucose 4,6-dehydratase